MAAKYVFADGRQSRWFGKTIKRINIFGRYGKVCMIGKTQLCLRSLRQSYSSSNPTEKHLINEVYIHSAVAAKFVVQRETFLQIPRPYRRSS
jgi:hypothetical protein